MLTCNCEKKVKNCQIKKKKTVIIFFHFVFSGGNELP